LSKASVPPEEASTCWLRATAKFILEGGSDSQNADRLEYSCHLVKELTSSDSNGTFLGENREKTNIICGGRRGRATVAAAMGGGGNDRGTAPSSSFFIPPQMLPPPPPALS